MDASELNARLFDVALPTLCPSKRHTYQQVEGGAIAFWVSGEMDETMRMFSPATSSDHLRLYVLPEISKRELWPGYLRALSDEYDKAEGDAWGMWGRWLLTSEPFVLAEAALRVLEGGE